MSRILVTAALVVVMAVTVKAHYVFIKLVVLAAAGLAGMYMIHVLSGDFQNVYGMFNRPGRSVHKELSIYEGRTYSEVPDFDYILRLDPKSCARRMICEIAAKSADKLESEEETILRFIREEPPSAVKGTRAFQLFRLAMLVGSRTKSPQRCAETYRQCPYTLNQMLKVLRLQDYRFIS